MVPDSTSLTPRFFKRQPACEAGEVLYFWRDIWDETGENAGESLAVWVLEDPLGMNKYSVRASKLGLQDDIADLSDSDHIAAADTEDEAKTEAIEWMVDQI